MRSARRNHVGRGSLNYRICAVKHVSARFSLGARIRKLCLRVDTAARHSARPYRLTGPCDPAPNKEPTTPDRTRPGATSSDSRSAVTCGSSAEADPLKRIRRAWRVDNRHRAALHEPELRAGVALSIAQQEPQPWQRKRELACQRGHRQPVLLGQCESAADHDGYFSGVTVDWLRPE
jgi:hypothetical protein